MSQIPPPKVVYQARELLRQGDLVLSFVKPTTAAGLDRSVLRVQQAGRSRDIPLDGTITGRRARMVASARYLPAVGRVVLHLDPDYDASGLLVIDIAAGAVLDAVTAHDLVASPDGRFWAFEEHAVRTVAVWPHTETVYAVYDAAAPPAANARPCPSADDRCRGTALFLPDRLALCRAIAAERGGPCLTPGRMPRHVRRSPFVWLSATELAWVDVDVARQDSTLVVAGLGDEPVSVRAVSLERAHVIEDVDFPSAREQWTIDGISRDGDPARLWLHFRSPLPQAPQRRLGIRVGRRRRRVSKLFALFTLPRRFMVRGWLVRRSTLLVAFLVMFGALALVGFAQVRPAGRDTAVHARKPSRLLIRRAMVIYGNGKPPYGPMDILVQDGVIANIAPTLPVEADAVIDATGKYVMPGLVDTHMHWHEERGGIPMPIQYERNLYLANGVTLTRENGGNFGKSKQWQAESAADQIIAPRMQVYWVVARGNGTAEAIRANVREAKARGADGLKIFGMDRDQLEATMAEAKAQGLKTTTHIAVEEVTAKDFAELGVDSIEHFYGIADAALDGVQHFPAEMNYSNELMRFSRAGELYAQADPAKLEQVLDLMVAKKVAWSPTLSIYEASRDVIKAQNLPWYKDYLHPALQAFFEPNLTNHGSYFTGWTNTMEVRWRQQYRIWMDALKSFGNKGGVITTGDDAGFIHSLYGFGLVRELELQEEAGFHPLDVIKHGTVNGATLLGMGDKLGRVRQGYLADLLVVNGNPLENLRVLNPYGIDVYRDGRMSRGGGIEWTIKNGIPYHVPTLMKEVKAMVDADRKKADAKTTNP